MKVFARKYKVLLANLFFGMFDYSWVVSAVFISLHM